LRQTCIAPGASHAIETTSGVLPFGGKQAFFGSPQFGLMIRFALTTAVMIPKKPRRGLTRLLKAR
jgi:hypothetical protein